MESIKYCFDIDGTICSKDCDYSEAKPYGDVIRKINELYNLGHHIILFTSRGSSSGIDWYDLTKKQLDLWHVKYHDLRMGKPHYDHFICDKAINADDYFN